MSNRCETCNWWIICAPGVPEGEGLCIRTPHPIYKAGPEECGMWEPKPLPSTSEVNEATAEVAARVAKETVERMFKPSWLLKAWEERAKAEEHRCGNCRHWAKPSMIAKLGGKQAGDCLGQPNFCTPFDYVCNVGRWEAKIKRPVGKQLCETCRHGTFTNSVCKMGFVECENTRITCDYWESKGENFCGNCRHNKTFSAPGDPLCKRADLGALHICKSWQLERRNK